MGVTAWIWAILGMLLVLSEFVVPQFVVFFFGLGALLNAVLLALLPGLADRVPAQLLIWAVTSGVSLGLLRRYLARWFRGENRAPGSRIGDEAGTTAPVIEAIRPDQPGRIRLRGTSWEARTYDSEPIPEGAIVTILDKESLAYIVTAGDLLNDTADPRPSMSRTSHKEDTP